MVSGRRAAMLEAAHELTWKKHEGMGTRETSTSSRGANHCQ